MTQNNQIQANADEVINNLTQQIAQLSTDNAVLKSLVNQYKNKVDELEQKQTDDN